MIPLKSSDLFAALRVVKELDAKKTLAEFAAKASETGSELNQRELGAELILDILANCGTESAEAAFYKFLSAPLEKTPEELRDMDLLQFAEMIKEYAEFVNIEDWRAFFTSLESLILRMRS